MQEFWEIQNYQEILTQLKCRGNINYEKKEREKYSQDNAPTEQELSIFIYECLNS